jgi:hypothetical protein
MLRVRERPEAAECRAEASAVRDRVAHRVRGELHRARLALAQEAHRVVEVVALHPRDRIATRAQRIGRVIGGHLHAGGRDDGDEKTHDAE